MRGTLQIQFLFCIHSNKKFFKYQNINYSRTWISGTSPSPPFCPTYRVGQILHTNHNNSSTFHKTYIVLGSFIIGLISDKYGRTKGLVLAIILAGGSGIIGAFVNNRTLFAILRYSSLSVQKGSVREVKGKLCWAGRRKFSRLGSLGSMIASLSLPFTTLLD